MNATADIDGAELAARVVDAVISRAPGTQVEVMVERTDQALTRFANSAIHQNVADESTVVRVRLHRDGRTVTIASNRRGDHVVVDLVDRALDAARTGPRDAGWPGLAPPSVIEAPAAAPSPGPPAQRAAAVKAFVDAAGGLETAGYARSTRTEVAFANSAGHHAEAVHAWSAVDGIARHTGHDGMARTAADTLGAIDTAALGARAAAKARQSALPRELPAGRYPVILEPAAAADLLWTLCAHGFNGKAVGQRQSFAEVGTAQFDPLVTIVDDAGAQGVTFDADGTPTRLLVLVDAGITSALTFDRRTAAETGASVSSTGHAFVQGPGGPVATNVTMQPVVRGAGDQAVAPEFVDPAAAPLLAGVEQALLVSDFWYTRVLDPKALAITGLTRNGVWLVENGAVTGAVTNLRFTQEYPAALAPGSVHGVGPVATGFLQAWSQSRLAVPALRLASWNFTGGASG